MTSALSCVICHDCNPMLRFFHVPTDMERLQQWSNMINLEFTTSSIVCEKHFLKEHITKNVELNCWRINSRAIPTLHLTDEDISDVKLINEFDYDKKDDLDGTIKKDCRTMGTQTKKFSNSDTKFAIKCLWCDGSFIEPDLHEILMHLRSKHHYEVEFFFDNEEDEILAPKPTYDEMEEDTLDPQDHDKEESCDIEGDDMETASINESISMKIEQFEDDDNGNAEEQVETYEIEQCTVKNEVFVKLDPIDDDKEFNIDETRTVQPAIGRYKMLDIGEVSNNQINMETSDSALIIFIIDLLKTMPTLWFINYFKSKEYETGFLDFCTQFSETYEYFMTQNELQESLIELRDWYLKVYKENDFDDLRYPLSDYYEKLAEFLPDKPNGKTCEFCGVLLNDHIQYFGHKNVEHGIPVDDDDNDDNIQTAVKYLKRNSELYFYARYPARKGGFSYQCQVCQVISPYKRTFFEHIKKHLDIRDHVCDICGKTFVKQRHFLIHQRRHQGTHKFYCKICGKVFTNYSNLTLHRKSYHRALEGTNEELERRFSSGKTCIRVRTGIRVDYTPENKKIYVCLVCNKVYQNSGGAYTHLNKFHPEIITKKKRKPQKKNLNETVES